MKTYKFTVLPLLTALLAVQGCNNPIKPQEPSANNFMLSSSVSKPSSTANVTAPVEPSYKPHLRRTTTGSQSPVRLTQVSTPITNPNERTSLNFVDAEIDQVVRSLAVFTGRNMLVDPSVSGTLTLVSENPVSASQAYSMLLAALRMQGFAITTVDGISRVVPEANAKLHSTPVAYSSSELEQLKGEIVTQVFRLQHEKANDLVPVLRPLVSPNNPINAYSNNNSIVITDYADNLLRINDIINRIDNQQNFNSDVVPIEYGVALDVAALASQLLNEPNASPFERIQLVADPRSNSIILRAGSPARLQIAKELIYKIDNPNAQQKNLHVIYLKNAQATHLAKVLHGVLQGLNAQPGNTQNAASSFTNNSTNLATSYQENAENTANSNNEGLPELSANNANLTPMSFSAGGATIQADPATNTLIVSAPAPLYRSIREVIETLDQRRAQVLVESLIVEVNADDANAFGIQWMFGGNNLKNGGSGVIGGANFGGSGIGLPSNGSTALDALPEGLNLGIVKGTLNIQGKEVINLGMLAHALDSQGKSNILSTPNLLTMDNEEASIIVGQTVPFVSGQYTTAADGASNPFQTIEREDVGLRLKIRPQISEGGSVKLALYQEVSSIDANLSLSASSLVTRKRAIDTKVLVDDGQIIVLGGLLEDHINQKTSKIPFLGDIPGLGKLFSYESKKRTKTNLMVFLRPHIIRDQQDSQQYTLDRYNYMRAAQTNLSNSINPQQLLPNMLPEINTSGQLIQPTLDLREAP